MIKQHWGVTPDYGSSRAIEGMEASATIAVIAYHHHYPLVSGSAAQLSETTYVEVPAEPPQPPQPTIASLAAARSVTPDTLLRTAALGLHDPPAVAPHLKFGILVSLALATVFMAGAKIGDDNPKICVEPFTTPIEKNAFDDVEQRYIRLFIFITHKNMNQRQYMSFFGCGPEITVD
ncbi:unnamed protein product [Leptidea sinapis]|uniref:Uncharacterized protein n=1 Tax=Leptidea sinapis TaxID=189913 RepID=A0A5E4QV43_9NEOP|nr:unnamed protein product [Leptidea sinapis]